MSDYPSPGQKPPEAELWYVRAWVPSAADETVEEAVDEGPWDRVLAEIILADIGVTATIDLEKRGIVPVHRARLVCVEDHKQKQSPATPKEIAHWKFLRWLAHQTWYEH